MELRPERPEDDEAVEALFDLAFAPGRRALSSYRLRDGVAPERSLGRVVRDGALVGAIRFWPVVVAGAPALLLGPVAVHPTRQGEGISAAMVEEGLGAALREGWTRALLVGDEPYYRRFGFRQLGQVEMPPPTNPDRVLGRDLRPGAWDGLSGAVERWTGAGRRPASARALGGVAP